MRTVLSALAVSSLIFTHAIAATVDTVPLSSRFPAPAGFVRAPVAPDTFAAWLRELPVRTEQTTVRAYDGRPLWRPAAAIVDLDVGTRDLQQCADSAIRLHAEYLWQSGRADEAAYHFTSGDRTSWRNWRRGERFRVRGGRVDRRRGAARPADHPSFRRWLDLVFMYAGTRSLPRDTDPVTSDQPIRGGDIFLEPGGPGHAVVVLDVALDADGRPVALLGQGFMPAEDFHVLSGSGPRVVDGVWYRLPDAAHPTIATPSWPPFGRDQVRRFRGTQPVLTGRQAGP